MGTNYYLKPKDDCPTCKRPFETKHIGKSSAGWCFALHVYPEEGINDLPDWTQLFASGRIVDEYENVVSPFEMLCRITVRAIKRNEQQRAPDDLFYMQNSAVPGPGNLARSKVDGRHCIGHGAGTWDLCIGEFS